MTGFATGSATNRIRRLEPTAGMPGLTTCNELSHELNITIRSIAMYTQYEALARERIREQREIAAQRRLSKQVASVRLWQRVADYSARRAARSQRKLAERSAEYQLAG
jgi:hypothetical protein